ncbi:uncharacterized protein LOC113767057 isoform X1 [Coffea eugenioides]|uniref:Uncharacterized protein isoform X1 n=1 Tax=Coffea arabica TaxID=13443 RepID=A0A6P6WV11_COFAR|nr:uncharacterized protein LOC113736455 isoform X1 [Coffea arabica]XP_027167027.1 uncharacterized protein LOC113767057 isoform X1 [Coffea eugenioides]
MNSSASLQNSLPDDIALKIALSLQVSDVCSLGSCSRFWRELCGSDHVWEALYRDRWPAIDLGEESSADENGNHHLHQQLDLNLMGWRGLYAHKHNEMARKAASIFNYVERCLAFEAIEVGYYLKAVEDLSAMQFGFKDVQMFFLRPNINVLFNLIGLHYCFSKLDLPAECVAEALSMCRISERQVCVRWWKLGRWFYGFRLRDESLSRNVTLGDLATSKEEEVLGVLHRGAIHEVLRVQISAAKPECTPW